VLSSSATWQREAMPTVADRIDEVDPAATA
jgi:hypothetical protein